MTATDTLRSLASQLESGVDPLQVAQQCRAASAANQGRHDAARAMLAALETTHQQLNHAYVHWALTGVEHGIVRALCKGLETTIAQAKAAGIGG